PARPPRPRVEQRRLDGDPARLGQPPRLAEGDRRYVEGRHPVAPLGQEDGVAPLPHAKLDHLAAGRDPVRFRRNERVGRGAVAVALARKLRVPELRRTRVLRPAHGRKPPVPGSSVTRPAAVPPVPSALNATAVWARAEHIARRMRNGRPRRMVRPSPARPRWTPPRRS